MTTKELIPMVKAALVKAEFYAEEFKSSSNPCVKECYYEARGKVMALSAVLDALVLNFKTPLSILAEL